MVILPYLEMMIIQTQKKIAKIETNDSDLKKLAAILDTEQNPEKLKN